MYSYKFNSNLNDYLNTRNQNFFRPYIYKIHPLYEKEFTQGVETIHSFLRSSILARATNIRKKTLYQLIADKCYSSNNNNFSFSEADACEKLILDKDPVLGNINSYYEEVKVNLRDQYEKNVLSIAKNRDEYDEEEFDRKHKSFMLKMNFLDRYYFYYIAEHLFINSLKN